MTTTTNRSESSGDPQRMAEAMAFGETFGRDAHLQQTTHAVYVRAVRAARVNGFTKVQAIVAAVEATKVYESRRNAVEEGRNDG